MKKAKFILMLPLAGLMSVSCVKEKLEVTYNKQEDQISKYIETALGKDAGYSVVHKDGSSRLTTVQGEGEELSADA